MRGCRCHGIVKKAQDAFADRLRGWYTTRQWRPTRIGVHVVCPDCGRVWKLELKAQAVPDSAGGSAGS